MKHKYFVYDPESGFETCETEEKAKTLADEILGEYRENAHIDGWSDDIGSVCWGEIKEQVVMKQTGKKIEFEGELVDSYNCSFEPR